MSGIVRFAPSPTGYLHEGHLLSALYVWAAAKKWDLKVHLRIEDHDQSRARPAYIAGIREDLSWLGFRYDSESIQSERNTIYEAALQKLEAKSLVYPCYCSRKQLQEENPKSETGEIVYQGKCFYRHEPSAVSNELRKSHPLTLSSWREPKADDRIHEIQNIMDPIAELQGDKSNLLLGDRLRRKTIDERQKIGDSRSEAEMTEERPHSLRFIVPDRFIDWHDLRLGDFHENPKLQCGDFPIRDREGQWTYQFAVCVDDIDENITHIVRGEDIRNSTARQIALMQTLGRTKLPIYLHHPLIFDTNNKKLSKRELAHSLRQDKEAGVTPETLFGRVLYKTHLTEKESPITLNDAIYITMKALP